MSASDAAIPAFILAAERARELDGYREREAEIKRLETRLAKVVEVLEKRRMLATHCRAETGHPEWFYQNEAGVQVVCEAALAAAQGDASQPACTCDDYAAHNICPVCRADDAKKEASDA